MTTAIPDPAEPVFDQSAFVADLLNRQDAVIEGLGNLADQIDGIIEEINRERQLELARFESAQQVEPVNEPDGLAPREALTKAA